MTDFTPQQTSPHPLSNRVGRLLWTLVYTLCFRASPRFMHRWRNLILRAFGAQMHSSARVYSSARIWAPWNLRMGRHACIGDQVDVYNVAMISIGDCATISQYSYLCGATHDFEDPHHPVVAKPITIGNYAWIAADVFVAPGVTVGDGAVVGARSSVFDDLPPWIVAVGSPAKQVRQRAIRGSDARESSDIRPFPPAP